MEYFQVRYDSRVVNYDHRGFIRLETGLAKFRHFDKIYKIGNFIGKFI